MPERKGYIYLYLYIQREREREQRREMEKEIIARFETTFRRGRGRRFKKDEKQDHQSGRGKNNNNKSEEEAKKRMTIEKKTRTTSDSSKYRRSIYGGGTGGFTSLPASPPKEPFFFKKIPFPPPGEEKGGEDEEEEIKISPLPPTSTTTTTTTTTTKEEELEEEETTDALSRLPNDVLCEISAKYLSAKDVSSLEQTSKQYREILLQSEHCWKNLYGKRYRWRPFSEEQGWALAATLPFSSGLQKKAIKPPAEGWKNTMKRAVLKTKFFLDDGDDDTRVVLRFSAAKDKVENINEGIKNLRYGDVCLLEAGTYYGSIRVPSGVHLRGIKSSQKDLVHIVADDEPAIVGVENARKSNDNIVMVSNVTLWRHRAARDGSIGCFGHHPKHTACVHSESKNIKLSLETCDIVSAGEGVVAHDCEIINCDVSTALSGIILRNGDISGCVVTSAIAKDQKSKIDIDSEASSNSSSDEADDLEMLGIITDDEGEEDDAISIDSQSSSASGVYASIVILGSEGDEDSAGGGNETSVDVRNSRIVLNSSHGISCLDGANATVRGCLIANNQGGGVCVGKNSRIRMFENLIALNTGVGFAVWGGAYGEALRCEIRENSHTGVDVSCLGAVKERSDDYYITYGGGGAFDEIGGNETDDEEYESELMSFLLAQRQRYAITHRIVLKECLIDNNGSTDINVSGGAHCDVFDCIIRKNSDGDERPTCVLVEKDSFLRVSP